MVAYQFTDKVSLRLNVYNLFDKEYLTALNNGGGRLALGAPRSAALTANVKF
jgi:catecholate siderophore receptor